MLLIRLPLRKLPQILVFGRMHTVRLLGDKCYTNNQSATQGCALCTVDKGIPRGIPKGPDPCPLDSGSRTDGLGYELRIGHELGYIVCEPCNVSFYHGAVDARCFLDLLDLASGYIGTTARSKRSK